MSKLEWVIDVISFNLLDNSLAHESCVYLQHFAHVFRSSIGNGGLSDDFVPAKKTRLLFLEGGGCLSADGARQLCEVMRIIGDGMLLDNGLWMLVDIGDLLRLKNHMNGCPHCYGTFRDILDEISPHGGAQNV
ncbi:MAG: hypothetical protein NTZ80_02330 [Patescibacteria group bacterium]|nr:hypothetical protein [Patescibacteria group bacterium]